MQRADALHPLFGRDQSSETEGMLPDPPPPTQGWAQHRENRAIVLDVENSPGVAACGLGAHSGVCCSKPGSPGGSQLWESQEVQFPSCQRTSCGSNIGQEVSKVGRVGRETELRAIQRSIRRGKLPSLLAGPWTQGTKACACTDMPRTGMDDGGEVSPH